MSANIHTQTKITAIEITDEEPGEMSIMFTRETDVSVLILDQHGTVVATIKIDEPAFKEFQSKISKL